MIARKLPAESRSSDAPGSTLGSQPVPPPNPGVEQETVAALAGLLAEVVELACNSAMYPGHLALIAEQAQSHACVRRALLGTDDTEPCPYCEETSGVQPMPAPAKVQAWRCSVCRTQWAVSVVNPHLRTASYLAGLRTEVEEMGSLRRTLGQVVTLAEEMPKLTNSELRDRLLTLVADAAR